MTVKVAHVGGHVPSGLSEGHIGVAGRTRRALVSLKATLENVGSPAFFVAWRFLPPVGGVRPPLPSVLVGMHLRVPWLCLLWQFLGVSPREIVLNRGRPFLRVRACAALPGRLLQLPCGQELLGGR